jgi:ABC-type antimicrobial peptide transport system permease subunit
MSPSIYGNIKMAVGSLKVAKMRSFLTMLGVIIGVVSVVTVVSIGEGIKHQVSGEINQLGRDLITVRPGDALQPGNSASDSINLFYSTANIGSLSHGDIETVQKTPGVRQAVPLALVNGPLRVADDEYANPLVLATTEDMKGLLDDPVEFGEFFTQDGLADQPNVAIIGHNLANKLFEQRVPLGRSFDYLGQTFFVRGVMKKFNSTPLSLNTDFNDAILIPYSTAQALTSNNTQLYEILAKPQDPTQLGQTEAAITEKLKASHGGQQRFSVLRQDESLMVTNRILDLLTLLIASIAAISLLVGGIGIMDVMLVSVAERMHEIGLRKALGASNRQIMLQFLTEATVLSLLGGIIGVIISLAINFVLRVATPLTPVISWEAIVVSVVVSLIVGVIFGTAPALKAARKDPIEALRSH